MSERSIARLAAALEAALGGTWRAECPHDTNAQEVFLVDDVAGSWAVAVPDPVGRQIALAAGTRGQSVRQADGFAPELGTESGLHEWLATAELNAPAGVMAVSLRTALDTRSEDSQDG